jgi:hypothetical protein
MNPVCSQSLAHNPALPASGRRAAFHPLPFPVVFTSIALLVVLPGCETGDTGTIDPGGTVPQVSNASITPDTVNVDTLVPSGGIYTFTTLATISASDADGDLSQVIARALRLSSTDVLAEAVLRDDGISPDQTSGDGVFAGFLEMSITRAEAGPYRIQISATDGEGLSSALLELTLRATRRNSPPVLDTESLVAPDTVQRPPTGTSLYFMSIAAADSDGIADITEVFFRNLNSASQSKQFLFDDGGVPGPDGIVSGDVLAGDGTFSIIFQVPSTVPQGTYQFAFQAFDTFGDSSATFIHDLVVE